MIFPKLPTRVVGLLRAVNVGGRSLVRMGDLTALMTDLGYVEPRTLLQSGNVVFGLRRGEAELRAVEARIQKALQSHMSLQSDVFVRGADEWSEIIGRNPFPDQAAADPSRLLLMVLKQSPPPAAVKTLQASIAGREVMHLDRRQLYVVYPEGLGRSKVTGTAIERALQTRGTARNWNTVLKLGALAGA
jgi:uncharacterized protein (DUF1697 family)